MSKITIQNIRPRSPQDDANDESYGFFVVTDAVRKVELGVFTYHVPDVSGPAACEDYPTEAEAGMCADIFVCSLNFLPDDLAALLIRTKTTLNPLDGSAA